LRYDEDSTYKIYKKERIFMKSVRKRVLWILLSVMILVIMLAGCGGTKSNDAGKGNTTDNTSTTTKESAPPVELRVEVFDRGNPGQTPVDNNYWTKWIQDNFGTPNNITMKFIAVPRSQEVDKLNIMMAANEAPDIVFTYNANVVYNYVKQGGLADLTNLIDEHGSNIKKLLGDEVLEYGRFNGRIYAIPAKRTMVGNTCSYIRKDWLDKLNMPLPTTTEEFYNTMKIFKEKNPGNVNGVIPWGLTGRIDWSAKGFLDSFTQNITEEEFATLPVWLRPGYKEGLKFLNRMYHEGLVSPEFAIDKDEKKLNSDASLGKVGFISKNLDFPLRNNPGINDALKKNVPGGVFVPVDTFTDYQGKYSKEVYAPNGIYNLIPKSSKRVVEAVKYLDWLARYDVIYYLQNGDEGVHHKVVDEIPQAIPFQGEKQLNSVQNIDYTLLINGMELGDKEKNAKAWTKSYAGYEDLAKIAYGISLKDGYTPFRFDRPIEADAKYNKLLEDKSVEMWVRLVTASPSEYDKLYDRLVDEYMKSGGQQVMDEKKAAYKAMKGN
jgi:putative aldouronate transport system substrate-binding protein